MSGGKVRLILGDWSEEFCWPIATGTTPTRRATQRIERSIKVGHQYIPAIGRSLSVPIANREVKPRWADGTAREIVWEIKSPLERAGFFFVRVSSL